MHLTNQKWVTRFKGHELIQIEQDIENTSWEFTAFQVSQSYIALLLQNQAFEFKIKGKKISQIKHKINLKDGERTRKGATKNKNWVCHFSKTTGSFKLQTTLAYHIPSRMTSQQHKEESIEEKTNLRSNHVNNLA